MNNLLKEVQKLYAEVHEDWIIYDNEEAFGEMCAYSKVIDLIMEVLNESN